MSEVFNNKRFWQYAKVRFAANRVFFFIPLFIPGIALLLIMSDLAFGGRTGITEMNFQTMIGFLAFFIFLILYSSRVFSEFHHKNRGFMLATIPASGFEKFLFSMLQVTLVFGVLYAVSWLVSAVMIAGYNQAIIPTVTNIGYDKPFRFSSMTKGMELGFISGNPLQFFNYLKLILSVTAAYATGSIFFRRFGFLFTSLIFLVYFWLTVNVASMAIGYKTINGFGNAAEIFMLPFTDNFSHFNHKGVAAVISLISLFIVIILLWIASYRRLKEKEY